MNNENDKEFDRMLESTDEWGEIPNPSLLEEIDDELELEAAISPNDLLRKVENRKRDLQAGFLTALGLILPFVAISGGEPLIMASLLVGTIILMFTGISYARSKVYWNEQMTMS